MTDVNIFQCAAGDWVGIYVDGELKSEGHSISLWDLQCVFGFNIVTDDEAKAGEFLDVWGGRCAPTWAEVEAVMSGEQG